MACLEDKTKMKAIINVKELNMRMGPGKKYPINGKLKAGEKYTIVEQKNGFGLLKSHAGWIDLQYCKIEEG